MDAAYFAFPVDIDFASHMVVPQESWRDSRDNIVVIDPTIVANLEEGCIGPITDTWSSEGKDRLGVGRNWREFAAYSADGGHRAAERVTCKPNGSLVLFESVFEFRP